MPPFIYRCPNTDYLIRNSEEVSDDGERCVAITCNLCRRGHLVNRATGEALGTENEWPPHTGTQPGE